MNDALVLWAGLLTWGVLLGAVASLFDGGRR